MRTKAYARPEDKVPEVTVAYTDQTRVGLLKDGAFYKNVEIYLGGETWGKFCKVWDEFYQGKTAEFVLADLLRKGINGEFLDYCIGREHE